MFRYPEGAARIGPKSDVSWGSRETSMGEADDVVMVPRPCRLVESHGPWAAADVQASAHATYLTSRHCCKRQEQRANTPTTLCTLCTLCTSSSISEVPASAPVCYHDFMHPYLAAPLPRAPHSIFVLCHTRHPITPCMTLSPCQVCRSAIYCYLVS